MFDKRRFDTFIFAVYIAAVKCLSIEAFGIEIDNKEILQQILTSPSTGSFLELGCLTSPMSYTVISRRDIQESGARTLTELLEIYVPGFQYLFNPFYGTLWGMRGICSDRNTKFIVLVNNHILNMQSRDGFRSELVLGMLGDIERIEVLRGPASLVYGSGAMAGIVNIITRRELNDTCDLTLSHGPFNAREADFYISRRLGKNQMLRGSLGWRQSAGMGIHESRLYGVPQWPFPDIADPTIDSSDMEYNGVPSNGSHGATPGNYKASLDWNWNMESGRKLRLYIRYTKQIESIAGLVIADPWPEIAGKPYLVRIDTSLQYVDSSSEYRVYNKTDNSYIGTTHDGEYYTPFKIPEEAKDLYRFFGYDSILPANTFWNLTESWGDNRRQYINENLMAELNYTTFPQLWNINWKVDFKYSYDNAANKTVFEKLPGYENINIASANTLERFGEQRHLLGVKALGKFMEPRQYNLQMASGIESRCDIIGKDWMGRNEWREEALHKVVEDVTYWTLSAFTEGFFSFKQSRKSENLINLNGGLRYDHHSRGKGMLNTKAAFVMIFPQWGPSEWSAKVIYQSSSNYGSADNYEPNHYNYDSTGAINYSFEKKERSPDEGGGGTIPPYKEVELKPESIVGTDYILSTSLFDNLIVNTLSFSKGNIRNLFVWSQEQYRIVNAGPYSYYNFDADVRINGNRFTAGVNHTLQRPIVTAESDTLVKNVISADGRNFLNLAANITKLYFTFRPYHSISFHTDGRIFWGYPGRNVVQKSANNIKIQYWNIDNLPLLKLDTSIRYKISRKVTLSLYAYDIFGMDQGKTDEKGLNSFFVRNSLRCIYIADPKTNGSVSTDRRSYAVRLDVSL